ncbi:MAG: rhomboid family intramembrane serine protease [Paludibacteraceae bacterium]|nr:rhomboid family intramembrane serine protease [Paludibacteraceae bacterium]
MSLKEDLIRSFREGNLLIKLIYINLIVFVIANLALVVCHLFQLNTSWMNGLMLSSNVWQLIFHPWSCITYMFLHMGFVHLICNVLMLYWFGQLFLLFFQQKDLVGVYIFGGLMGGLIYFAAYNIIPYYMSSNGAVLMGASASVMAVAVATAVMSPEYQVRIPLIGNVKIEWIALATVLISLLSITSQNAGGELAHLGGALAGYLFASRYKKGKNIVAWVNRVIDALANVFRKRKGMRVSYENEGHSSFDRMNADMEYNAQKKQKEEEINRILEKIKQSGYDSLSSDERAKLFGK